MIKTTRAIQSNYQTQNSSNFPFLHNRTQTPLKCRLGQKNAYYARVGTKKCILRPSRLVKYPEALHSDFYPFEIVSLVKKYEALHSDFCTFETVLYEQTKRLMCFQLKTHTRNINALAIEKSYVQLQHQRPNDWEVIRAILWHSHQTRNVKKVDVSNCATSVRSL